MDVNGQDTKALSTFLFSKLKTIMSVYKLRAKDLFASLDRDSDGVIGPLDMHESLQVLGVVDVLPRESTQLIRYVTAQCFATELDFHAFEFAMRRNNNSREKSLSRRMGHYVGSQNALSNKILQSQSVTAQLHVALAGSTGLDATKSIQDPQGKEFWKNKFSVHVTTVSLKRFMKELKKFYTRRGVRINNADDEWVYRRIQSFLTNGNQGKVSSTRFGQLLETFGSMQILKRNVMSGPLLSNFTKKKLRHRARVTSVDVRFSRGKTKIVQY